MSITSPGEAADRYGKLHHFVEYVAGANPDLEDREICEIVVEEWPTFQEEYQCAACGESFELLVQWRSHQVRCSGGRHD